MRDEAHRDRLRPCRKAGGVTITVNGLAGEIDWRETDVGLVARLGLKIIRSEVVADSVAERLRTLDPALVRHRSTMTAQAYFRSCTCDAGFQRK
jgi:hypothetical protein